MRFCYDDVGYMLWEMGYRAVNRQVEKDIVEMLEDVHPTRVKNTLAKLIEAIPYWFIDEIEEQEAYVEENLPKLNEYYSTHFANKTRAEILASEELMSHWDFYSDWHKDVHGFRPHF